METITKSALREFAEISQPHCVSIYMPTHRTGRETQQDPVRLKGLLNQAEEELTRDGMRATEARDMLEEARALISDSQFWGNQVDGLSLLITPSKTSWFRLPRQFEEICFVSDRFLLTPLVPVANEDAAFLLLAVSPKRVRLLAGSRDDIEEMDVDGLPKDFDELGKYIDTERSLQFHTRAAPTGGATSPRAAVFHGQGVGTDDAQEKKQLLEFCRMIERSLQPILANRKTPLILAADQSFIPIYQEVNAYQHTLEKAVTGNPDQRSEEELREAAWPIIREVIDQEKAQMLAVFHQAAADGQGSNVLEDVLPAAFDGRISALLVGDSCHAWGSYDVAGRTATVHDQRQQGDDDLLNLAAATSMLKDTDIYIFEAGEMPNQSSVAAVYRY